MPGARAVLACLLLLAACRTPPSRSGSGRPLGELEIDAAGKELGAKLATLPPTDRSTLRIVKVENQSSRSVRTDLLEDEARRRAVESNVFRVTMTDNEPTHVLLTTVSDSSGGVTIAFEVVERASHKRVLLATKEFAGER